MTGDMLITLAILGVAILLFVTEWVRVDVVALGVVVSLVIFDVITIDQGIAGFSNKAVISIAALFVVGGAVFHTGLAQMIGAQVMRIAGTNERRLLIVLMLSVAGLSAFISSTGVVALLLPAVVNLANRTEIPTSRLLIPVSFSALLGGTATLIGTPPNLIASEALITGGYPGLGFFDFSLPAVLLIGVGVAYMSILGPRLLPTRVQKNLIEKVETPEELFDLHELPRTLFRLAIPAESALVGKAIQATRLRRDYGLTIVRIVRPNPQTERRVLISHPEPSTLCLAGDEIIVQGDADKVHEAAAHWNLIDMPDAPVQREDIITKGMGIAEVLLRPRSSYNGKTINEIGFGHDYHVTVLGVKRPGGDTIDPNHHDSPIKTGDMILVQGSWEDIFALKKRRNDFIVMGESEAAQIGAFARFSHAPIAMVVMVGMVAVIALNVLDLTTASLLAGLLMVVSGCLTMDEAYKAIDWKSLVLIAGMLPMSTALESVGVVEAVSNGLVDTLGGIGPIAVMMGLFVIAMGFTQVLSNTTTAVLLAPVALLAASEMGVAPQAFIMAIAFAVSLAFATPVASPVNALVMTAGNYRFKDYARVGLPFMAISMVILLVILPILYQF